MGTSKRVKDGASAQAAAERLNDYRVDELEKKKPSVGASGKGNQASQGKGNSGERKFGSGKESSSSKSSGAYMTNSKPLRCFLSGGPQRVANCPQKQALNV